MRTRARLAILLAVLAGTAVARTMPPLSIVLRTGDRAADGLGVSSIGVPVAGAGGEVFFRGTTSAVLEADGGVFRTVAACGDPLPAPYQGTFGHFTGAAVNDAGAVAFTADLDGPGLLDGLFLREGTTVTPVSIDGVESSLGPGTGPFALNRAGDIVTVSARFVSLWTRETGETETLAALPKRPSTRFTDRPAIGDGGHVAWLARPSTGGGSGGVYTWQPRVGALTVVEEQGASISRSTFRNANVAINATGAVAWVSTRGSPRGAFVWDPDTHVTRPVARPGDLVDGVALSGFGRYVGIDAQGAVVFLGRLKGAGMHLVRASGGMLTSLAVVTGAEFPGRLPDSGRVAWSDGGEVRTYDGQVKSVVTHSDPTPVGTGIVASAPSVNDAGTVAFLASHEALLRLADGVTTPVVQAGDTVPGGGSIGALGPYQAGTGGLASFAVTADGQTVLLRRSAAELSVVASDRGQAPGGRTFVLPNGIDSQAPAVGNAGVAFWSQLDDGNGEYSSAQGVFVASGRRVRVLVLRGDRAPGGERFDTFSGALAVGNGVAFGASLTGNPARSGLFWNAHHRTTRIAVTGQDAPGTLGQVFTYVGGVAASGDRVLFHAQTGADSLPGLFLWTHGRLTRLRTDATAGGPLTDPFVFEGSIALAGRQAFAAGRIGDVSSVYRVGRRGLQPLLVGPDLSALGGMLVVGLDASTAAAAYGYVVSPRGDRLTVVAPVTSGGARGVVLSRPLAGGR